MHIAVIGGTGLIGSRLVRDLDAAGHRAVAHSHSTGVDVITGEGMDAALSGADVVVDVTNSPTFDDASPDFFRTSMDNLVAAARKADVQHFVVLSIVGVDQVPELDCYRAKTLQEDLLKAGPVPHSIVRATQFMEFIDTVLSWTADGTTVRLPRTRLQPVAAADVAATVAEIATGTPLHGTVDLAGPDAYPLDELGRITLRAKGDERSVTTDETAGMFAAVKGDALAPKDDAARIGTIRYADWLAENA
ncbi:MULTISPECIES: NAD(P)H-binding protein [unclassified Streptomyces]|uniref:SDR family oxidoreductase n=1 Tax=unclassified Streptomyces TaxID=2593676 RepID=UPI0033B17E9B